MAPTSRRSALTAEPAGAAVGARRRPALLHGHGKIVEIRTKANFKRRKKNVNFELSHLCTRARSSSSRLVQV